MRDPRTRSPDPRGPRGDWLSLERLVSPIPLDRFKRDGWGRRAVVARGPVGRFGALAELPALWSAEAVVLAHREPVTVCYPQPWLRGVRPRVAPTADFPAGESLVLHSLGASIYVRQFERFDPVLNRALSSLRGSVGSTTRVHCDLLLTGQALPAGVPLPEGPLFLVHLHGKQRWAVEGDARGGAPRARAGLGSAGAQSVPAKPGTVLYLPRGAARLKESTGGAMTLVVSVPTLSAIEPVLRGATELMLRVEALRAPALVPPTASGKRRALSAAEQVLEALPAALRDLDPRRLLAESRGRRLARAPGARASLRPLPGHAGLSVLAVRTKQPPPTEVTLDAPLAQACAWVLAQRSGFWEEDVRTALGLDSGTLTPFLDALIQAGLLQERRS